MASRLFVLGPFIEMKHKMIDVRMIACQLLTAAIGNDAAAANTSVCKSPLSPSDGLIVQPSDNG